MKRKEEEECPYLDTVNRQTLDFDNEKQCSVTLSFSNVYCCLVCGKFLQGRGKETVAYEHSIDLDHHLFLNMTNAKVYSLPENYEVKNSFFSDIQNALLPQFTKKTLEEIENKEEKSKDLFNTEYYPGYMGINETNQTSILNSLLLLFAHVKPLRDFLLLKNETLESSEPFTLKFQWFIKRIWDLKAWKGTLNPHLLITAIQLEMEKKKVTLQEPQKVFLFFFNLLQQSFPKVLKHCFQGEIMIRKKDVFSKQIEEKVTPFLMLQLQLPAMPVFQPSDQTIIPQVPLSSLLQKYTNDDQYEIQKTAPYLLLSIKNRLQKNEYDKLEKNSSIILLSSDQIRLNQHTFSLRGLISHDGTAEKGKYVVYLKRRETWLKIQELSVQELTFQQLILTESFLYLFERVRSE